VFGGIRFTYESPDASGMRTWQDCVRECIATYGTDCFYVQFDRQTADGTCIISRPCGGGGRCSRVSDVNKSGLDYNRVNCKRPEYVVVQERTDAGVAACRNVF
jgi:hypothetical protein